MGSTARARAERASHRAADEPWLLAAHQALEDGVPVRKGEEVCPNVTMRDGVGLRLPRGHTGAQCDSCEWPAWSENQNGICERCDAEETRDRSFVVLGVGLVLLLSVGSAMAAIVHRKASRGTSVAEAEAPRNREGRLRP